MSNPFNSVRRSIFCWPTQSYSAYGAATNMPLLHQGYPIGKFWSDSLISITIMFYDNNEIMGFQQFWVSIRDHTTIAEESVSSWIVNRCKK